MDEILNLKNMPLGFTSSADFSVQLENISKLLFELRELLSQISIFTQYVLLLLFIIFVLLVVGKVLDWIEGIFNYF